MAKVQLLVVDDDPFYHELLKQLLSSDDREITHASDGREGLREAKRVRPDLIILDIKMPEMGGFTMMQHLRSQAEFALTPVIFLTSMKREDDRRQGFRLGADDFISKDMLTEMEPGQLSARVDEILKQTTIFGDDLDEALHGQFDDLAEVEGIATGKFPIATKTTAETEEKPILTGSLGQIGLPSLLTILEMESRTGLLKLGRSEPEGHARFYMCDGRVLTIAIEGQPERNLEALALLLDWQAGEFAFLARDVQAEDELQSSTTGLLMKAACLSDESNRELDPFG